MIKDKLIQRFDSSGSFLKNFPRNKTFDEKLRNQVSEIITQVINKGDKVLFDYTKKFDDVIRESLKITDSEWKSIGQVKKEDLLLFEEAAQNIRDFHQKEFEQLNDWYLTSNNSRVGQRVVPIRRAGIYVPGGTANYPSSVLMNIIPAQVAGVEEIVLVCPPNKNDGFVNPHVLAIAKMLNISEIYAIGGAQAIAALAYGTETISPVDKITGPGNRYVAEAKRQVFGQVGIDSIAGPSEIVILADESGNPKFLAADLLSQAEHDEFAQAILISADQSVLNRTESELFKQLETLPRKSIAETSLKNQGAFIFIKDLHEGIGLVNHIAPEHLELQINDADRVLSKIKNAGAVFIGLFTPEPVGDYWAGSNHILPTSGNVRFASALSVRDFLKWISVVEYDKNKLKTEGNKIARFARLEGLEAHARAVDFRINDGDI